jgi:hypothetical protein
LPIATNPITETAGTSAHQPLRKARRRAGAHARGSATTNPWQSDRIPIDAQNGNTQSK